jgi:4-hydroxy-4-methyl-2-oxoglutarate aldolase
MSNLKEVQIINELRKFDTASICNVVATYGGTDICLSIYDPWLGEYYTDASIRCMYPDLGPVCGYSATALYSDKRPESRSIDRWTLPEHLNSTPKPAILVAKQTYSAGLENRSGLFGGVLTAQFKALGVVGVLTDGAIRDLEEIREQKVQYLATGLTSGHGDLQLCAAGLHLKVAGMAVEPGEIIHMDQCGAVKFPVKYLPKVLEYVTELLKREENDKLFFQNPGFSLKNWKDSVKRKVEIV